MNLKQELVQYYKWLRQYGLNDSHSGNASVRDADTVWITPTGACADTLTEDDLIACHINQPPADGASLDAPLHLAAYRNNPKLNAVLHSHGAHTVAMTMNGNDFMPFDFEGQYYFGKIPVINLEFNEVFVKSAQLVAEELKTSKAVVVCGHGVYAAAESLNQAYKWTCSLELSTKTAFIAQQAGTFPQHNCD
ncbi:MAG: class II aldolase/adducin family protein [Gammaproteobacteria bacterium]|nr:class II aldolase/adducin family protein [Gammaproteobacteria bacterium]